MLAIKELQDISNILRADVLKMTSAAGSGHPTSCLSSAEIISSLFFNEMSYDIKNANNPDNDEFILSKGHAAPILYAALKRAGCIPQNINEYRKLFSPLEGHPIPHKELTNWIKVATGSLGQGLSVGIGYSLAAKLQKRDYKTYVLLGDSETAEGSIWEAFQIASYYKLNNLVAILDINRLGQRGETMLAHNTNLYAIRLASLGWNTIVINGHNIPQIISAFKKGKNSGKPTAIIAKTFKGNPISFLKDKNGWHGKALNSDELQSALKQLPSSIMPEIKIKQPITTNIKEPTALAFKSTNYKLGELIATREAYGKALANLSKSNSNILALDAEVSNSTFAELVKKQTPKQFLECFIAEQNMISMCLGLSKKGFNVFGSTFAAFLSRAHDQIRMSALSNANFTISGSHSGISIGEDGASQMGLEDISLFRATPKSIIFYPSDAVSTEKLVYLASNANGIKYIRTTRPKTPVIYNNNEDFAIADFKILRSSDNDKAVIIGSGITVHEALKAHETLKQQHIQTAVIDLYCIKPLNISKLCQFIKSHGSAVVTAEDHYPEGGIGEMLSSSLSNTNINLKSLAVKEIPHSGRSEELLDKYGISARHIFFEVKKLI